MGRKLCCSYLYIHEDIREFESSHSLECCHEVRIGKQNVHVNDTDPRSNVHYLSGDENKAWKNLGLHETWTHDLCDTGTVLYQLS